MTQPPERDSSGRFVKPPPQEQAKVPYTEDEMHPVSQLLFGWVEDARTPRYLFAGLSVLCVLLIVSDLIVNRHDYFHFAESTAFYAFWGFGAFAFAVLSGWPLGALLRRDEDYYGEADTTPDDVEPEA